MTRSTFDAHQSRWSQWEAATEDLTHEECARADAFLVGWLSGLVTPEQWAHALEEAVARTVATRALYQDNPSA